MRPSFPAGRYGPHIDAAVFIRHRRCHKPDLRLHEALSARDGGITVLDGPRRAVFGALFVT